MKPQSAPTIVIIVLALVAVIAGGLALVGGLDIHRTKPSVAEEQAKAAIEEHKGDLAAAIMSLQE